MNKGYLINLFRMSVSLLAVFSFSSSLSAIEQSYDIPIKFNMQYVTNPEKLIIDSLSTRGWQVKDNRPGQIIGWLNDYKGYEIILAINYDKSQISFKKISSEKLGCSGSKKKCKVESKHYNRWRLYLRKTIALNIHTLAIIDLLKTPSIKNQWLSSLKEGSVKQKIKFARNMIDIQLFDRDALEIIKTEIMNGYKKSKMTADEIQQYAFYCKVLASTQDPHYLSLLTEVSHNSPIRKLKRYVKGYLGKYYSKV